jgi:hypothetical protein
MARCQRCDAVGDGAVEAEEDDDVVDVCADIGA